MVFPSTPLQRLVIVSVVALVVVSAVTTDAQPVPVQVVQGSDGALYLTQDTNAWTIAPSPISDDDLAALKPSGELVGAIPSPFLSAPDLPALKVVQDGSGTLYLVQADNVWTLVPVAVSDAGIAALTIVGTLDGEIAAPALQVPAPAADNPPPPPPAEAAQPAAPPPPLSIPATTNPSGMIKIVSSLPRTGMEKRQTDALVNAFHMALDEANNRVGDMAITYVDMDDATAARRQWDAAQEASNANRASNDRDVMVYIGPFDSSAAKVSIPILCHANLGMISPAGTYPGLTKKIDGVTEPNEPDVYYTLCKHNYTRVAPSDELQGAAAASWARQLGASKVYLLFDAQVSGQGVARAFAAAAPKSGLQILFGPDQVTPELVDPFASDYTALAQKIRQAGADTVFFGGTPYGFAGNLGGRLWQDLRAVLGTNVRLMGTAGMYETAWLDATGAAAEGAYITFGGLPPSRLSGAGAQWYQRYKQQFNAEPEAYAAYGYEAMKAALDAIQRAGRKDRAAIRDALVATHDVNGAVGAWSFTSTGDTTLTTITGRQVRAGKFDDANMVTLRVP